MTPFTDAGRREGLKAMEESMTSAKKVARRLAGGRKPKTEKLGKKVAALRAVTFLESAGDTLQEYGLDPEDLRVHLIYATGEIVGHIPLAVNPAEFFERLEKLDSDVLFLGIMGELRDREANDTILRWVRPFIATPLAAAALIAFRGEKGTVFLN